LALASLTGGDRSIGIVRLRTKTTEFSLDVQLLLCILFKAIIAEPQKQPLTANGSETFISRQRLGKNVPPATDTQVTIEVLLEIVFNTRPVQKGLYGRQLGATKSVL
jgi:hypothetical protein